MAENTAEKTRDVALFVTCLVDMVRPSVGLATVRLLEDAGCRVVVPRQQTCCGQPAWNNGDSPIAADLARQVIAAFEGFDDIVLPSGSCAGMMIKHYPALFADDPAWKARAEAFAGKVRELTQFLQDHLQARPKNARFSGKVTYHDSCAGLRELSIHDQPRALLDSVEGLELVEMNDANVCCGFGGTFAVKYGEISDHIAAEKCRNVTGTGADMVLAGDLGCLMNIAGKLKRDGSPVQVRHVAEILAGEDFCGPNAAPPLGEGSEE